MVTRRYIAVSFVMIGVGCVGAPPKTSAGGNGACLCKAVGNSTVASTELDSAIASAIDNWNFFLSRHIRIGMSIDEIDAVLKGIYRDHAILNLSGDTRVTSAQYYLIDDYIQIYFTLNSSRHLSRDPVVERRGPWIKSEGGYLSFIPASPTFGGGGTK